MAAYATLICPRCDGERPDCLLCNGSGNMRCDVRGCKAGAVGFSEDGTAMCEDCLGEWIGQVEAEAGITKRPKNR